MQVAREDRTKKAKVGLKLKKKIISPIRKEVGHSVSLNAEQSKMNVGPPRDESSSNIVKGRFGGVFEVGSSSKSQIRRRQLVCFEGHLSILQKKDN